MKKSITYKKIVALNPCYDPIRYLSKDWQGSGITLLKMQDIPAKDRLWVIVRADFLTLKQIHAYGLACARLSEQYLPDKRVKECNDVVERYLKGKASREELSAAESAACATSANRASSTDCAISADFAGAAHGPARVDVGAGEGAAGVE